MNTVGDNEVNQVSPDRDLFGNPKSAENSGKGKTPPPVAQYGHNRRVFARDLLQRAPGHERRYISDADHEMAASRAAEPWNWRPFFVVRSPNGYLSVDGTVLLEAIVALDSNAQVEIIVVEADEVLRIRSQDNATRSKREPMAIARRALILTTAGRTLSEIARELRVPGDKEVSEARVSQFNLAARAEKHCAPLGDFLADPAQVPVRFWECIGRELNNRASDDARAPIDGESRRAGFERQIKTLIAELEGAQSTISHQDCLLRLGVGSTAAPPIRNRHVGEKHQIPGTNAHVGYAPKRSGGVAISLPSALTKDEAKLVFDKVLAEVARLLAERPRPKSN